MNIDWSYGFNTMKLASKSQNHFLKYFCYLYYFVLFLCLIQPCFQIFYFRHGKG